MNMYNEILFSAKKKWAFKPQKDVELKCILLTEKKPG